MSPTLRRLAVSTLACGLAAGALSFAPTALAAPGSSGDAASAGSAAPSRTVGKADFNNDGYADLAVGVPLEDITGVEDAGSVQLFYGSRDGVRTDNATTLSQNTDEVADTAEEGDRFGAAVAVGDFNGDDYSDLAVGVPLEDVGTRTDAGVVQVFYGSRSGLRAAGDQLFSQNSSRVADSAETSDRFGWTLAAADVAGSSQDDLVVGVPYENVGSVVDAGAVHVLRGSARGLTGTGSQLLHQNAAGVADTAERGDRFGWSLAAGDFGDSRTADLAVGVPFEDVGSVVDAGVVQVFPGSTGPVSTADTVFSQNSTGVEDKAERSDQFGSALAAADLAGGSQADLAVGIPLEDVGGQVDAGAIQLLRGSGDGLTTASDQFLSQDTPGVADASEKGDRFGSALAAGDLSGDAKSELAVGIPLEDLNAGPDAGAVQVFSGATVALRTSGNLFLTQPGSERGDRFGSSVVAANLAGSRYADLAAGAPLEDVGETVDAGSVQVARGAADGLTFAGGQVLTQNLVGISAAEEDDRFGTALDAG